jgi:hypothetical protein
METFDSSGVSFDDINVGFDGGSGMSYWGQVTRITTTYGQVSKVQTEWVGKVE